MPFSHLFVAISIKMARHKAEELRAMLLLPCPSVTLLGVRSQVYRQSIKVRHFVAFAAVSDGSGSSGTVVKKNQRSENSSRHAKILCKWKRKNVFVVSLVRCETETLVWTDD